MSVDVEDWFHDANLESAIAREDWGAQQLRVERSMDRMLELMEEHGVRSTCFVLGWVAARVPELVRRISAAGHEVASHGDRHELVYTLTRSAFRSDVERSKALLEDITGREIVGYRAPNFSLTEWALDVLADLGFEYDSSLFPTSLRHDRYGRPEGLTHTDGAVFRHGRTTEVSLSCLDVAGYRLPWSGGGYFRLLPYSVFRRGVRRILATGTPFVFYIHPWEIDVGQPRINGLTRGGRLRHYLNLHRTELRFDAILRDFSWTTIADLVAAAAVEGQPEHASERDPRVDVLAGHG